MQWRLGYSFFFFFFREAKLGKPLSLLLAFSGGGARAQLNDDDLDCRVIYARVRIAGEIWGEEAVISRLSVGGRVDQRRPLRFMAAMGGGLFFLQRLGAQIAMSDRMGAWGGGGV